MNHIYVTLNIAMVSFYSIFSNIKSFLFFNFQKYIIIDLFMGESFRHFSPKEANKYN